MICNLSTLSFHNNLKTNYLNGKVNRRVDYLLCALLDIESDYYFKYNQKQLLGGLNPKAAKEELRHHRGMMIPPLSVKVRSLEVQKHEHLCTLLKHKLAQAT